MLPGLSEIREAVSFEGWLGQVRRTPKRSELPEVDPESATQIQFTAPELHDHVRARLAPHKTPRSWYVATAAAALLITGAVLLRTTATTHATTQETEA